MVVARVILKGAKSYKVGDRRFIKDVPQIIKGEEEVTLYEQNGYFHVSVLKGAKKVVDEEEDYDDEDDVPKKKKSSPAPALKKKSLGLKRRT